MKKLLLLFLVINNFVIAQPIQHQCASQKRNLNNQLRKYQNVKEAGPMIDVHFYDIFWNIDPAFDSISGNVKIHYAMKSESTQITIDLANTLMVDSINADIDIAGFSHQDDIINIDFEQVAEAGTHSWVQIYYHGSPAKITDAFTQTTHNGHPVIWTLSEPYGAKEWWPCKQSLSDKPDSVDLSINVPQGNKAASNGILTQIEENGNYAVYHWQHRHPIATYLVAIAVTNYDVFTDTAIINTTDSIPVVNYVFPEDSATWQINAHIASDAITFFSERFIDYPYANEKYGHAQFGWSGGMEHQTMSFMANLGKDLVVHELAHQWFGDYITCGSWADIWLNEGFATYCEGLFKEWEQGNETFTSWRTSTVNYIVTEPHGSVYVYDTTSVWNIFNYRLSYAKAGMVLHQLRTQLGDELFFESVNNYLTNPQVANGFAVTNDLKSAFETTADTTLDEYFNDWIYDEGYPMYDITWEFENDNLYLLVEQSQSHSSVDFFEMKIPVFIEGASNDTMVWMHNTQNEQIFEISSGFEPDLLLFDPDKEMISKNNDVQEGNVVGIAASGEEEVIVYPNPSRDYFIIDKAEKAETLRIFDISGRNVLNLDITKNRIEHNLSSGIYLLQVNTQNGKTIKQQIIVQ